MLTWNSFHANLSHTRWGLDPRIYTVSFTRLRSAFLLTSVMAASALFMSNAALSKRLSNHAKILAGNVMRQKHKSVEIVLAFLVNVPWMPPSERSTDDKTCFYISTATTIAIDLSLHKTLVAMNSLSNVPGSTTGRGESLDTRAALAMDGYPDLDPDSTQGRLILRSRERCYLSLFNLDRG